MQNPAKLWTGSFGRKRSDEFDKYSVYFSSGLTMKIITPAQGNKMGRKHSLYDKSVKMLLKLWIIVT